MVDFLSVYPVSMFTTPLVFKFNPCTQTKDGQRHFSLVPCKAQARSLQDGHRHFSLIPCTAQARSLQNGHWHFSLIPCSAQARFLQDGHRHFGLALQKHNDKENKLVYLLSQYKLNQINYLTNSYVNQVKWTQIFLANFSKIQF